MTAIQEILREMYEEGGFEAVVLTSAEGLPIVSLPTGYDSDVTAAMVALLQRVSQDAQNQVGMAPVDEVMIRDQDGVRLVSRYLQTQNEQLILAVVVPWGAPYRRLTNRAVREIRRLLD
jgi:predicted regulator of Ras-like GTPase activity (Roadblock/LC7/MglB family)